MKTFKEIPIGTSFDSFFLACMKTQKQLLVRRFMSDDCPREIIKAWNKQETRRIRFVKANIRWLKANPQAGGRA